MSESIGRLPIFCPRCGHHSSLTGITWNGKPVGWRCVCWSIVDEPYGKSDCPCSYHYYYEGESD